MNYYERHIGDYIRDTVSLTMLEDGAYNRLLDQYYQTGRPLSLDRKMVYRLARATSAAERKAVDFVLDTFFQHTEEGYTQKRVQAEIERFSEKQRKAKASAEARWSKSKGNANAFELHGASDMRTHSEGNAHQTPDTNHQTPVKPTTTTDVVVADSQPAADPMHVGEPDQRPGKPDCPHQQIIALYHDILPMCPPIRDWTPARAQALRARWNENKDRQNLDYWRRFFTFVADSDFLTGRTSSAGRKPFRASLEWMCKAENFTKIREERYHEGAAA